MIEEIRNIDLFAFAETKFSKETIRNGSESDPSVSSLLNNIVENSEDGTENLAIANEEDFKKEIKGGFENFAEKLSSFIKEDDRSVEFSVDSDTNRMIFKILDSKTNELIQQFPPEVSLQIARIVSNISESGQITNVKV